MDAMNVHPLRSKFVKATDSFPLINTLVDGKYPESNSCYIPFVHEGQIFRVKDVSDDEETVILANVSNDDYNVCELKMETVENFKIVSQTELDSIF